MITGVLRTQRRMDDQQIRRRIVRIENILRTDTYDFAAKYMAICELRAVAVSHPGMLREETIPALTGIMKDAMISRQTQSYFLFKEAAGVLSAVITHSPGEPLAEHAYSAVMDLLNTTAGNPLRAAAEALGSLPLQIHGPQVANETVGDIPDVKWENLLEQTGMTMSNAPVFFGRTLVATPNGDSHLLAVKLACAENSFASISREAAWIEHLHSQDYSFPMRFNIPVLIKVQGSHVFRLEDIPVSLPGRLELHPERYAIAFVVHRDYFTYPNDHRMKRQLTRDAFREVMFRNAWLLGKLTSLGIVHSAAVPLFHNRVQRHRRTDNGVYEWQRAGRLDRWLESCLYPNFGLAGIRDFEHLISLKDSNRSLHWHIGTHLLSLFLVAGSHFRNKDRGKIGLNGEGRPVDARDLFDRPFLKELIQGIFLRYYHGFAGRKFSGSVPFDFDELTARMIEEMGVDRHMEEILRVADQREMSDQEFMDFLVERGYSEEEVRSLRKGVEDITVYTGPHLGGFNQRISLPEFVESIGSMSALCILGRYWREKAYPSFFVS